MPELPPGIAVITGASSGIGEAFARLISAAGRPTLLVARRRARLEALAAALPGPAELVVADLSTPEGVAAVVEAVGEREVGLLVNNAGAGAVGRFHELDPARQAAMVRLNCAAVLELTHRLLPGMLARGRGGVIVVASTSGFLPNPYMSVYSATKAFDLHFAEGLAEELAGTGVHALALCPGPVATEFGRNAGVVNDAAAALYLSPEAAARAALSGLGRQVVVVPGLMNKLTVFLARWFPRSVVRWSAGRVGKGLMG